MNFVEVKCEYFWLDVIFLQYVLLYKSSQELVTCIDCLFLVEANFIQLLEDVTCFFC